MPEWIEGLDDFPFNLIVGCLGAITQFSVWHNVADNVRTIVRAFDGIELTPNPGVPLIDEIHVRMKLTAKKQPGHAPGEWRLVYRRFPNFDQKKAGWRPGPWWERFKWLITEMNRRELDLIGAKVRQRDALIASDIDQEAELFEAYVKDTSR